MDVKFIDENMTVPHPSREITVTVDPNHPADYGHVYMDDNMQGQDPFYYHQDMQQQPPQQQQPQLQPPMQQQHLHHPQAHEQQQQIHHHHLQHHPDHHLQTEQQRYLFQQQQQQLQLQQQPPPQQQQLQLHHQQFECEQIVPASSQYSQRPALLLKTFVVDKQPPQVMKTHTRFTASVKFSSANVLNISAINPKVRVTILSENNARAIIQRHREMLQSSWALEASAGLEERILNINEFESSGEILNNISVLEYEENTGQLVCHFRNMQLKKIKRTEKKGTESVMDEKFVLLFHCVFRCAPYEPCSTSATKVAATFNQADLVYHIMAFSLPVVVIVHGNQEPHAWATVTWHNAFARPDELLYQVPDRVPWRELGQVLSDKFKSCAGRGLSQNNLDYLANKVCRAQVEGNEAMVSWNQFAKETLQEKSFTFWEWFHSVLKLTREHLRNLWNADRIYGFVDKAGCLELLQGDGFVEPKPVGTFLLRYSETELGGITIAWYGPPQRTTSSSRQLVLDRNLSPINANLPRAVQHLQPFTSKDLNTRSLADRIRDLCDLVYLYPNIPKNDAFCDYYTRLDQKSAQSNGYVKSMLIQTLVTNYPDNPAENNTQNSEFNNRASPSSPDSVSQCSEGMYQSSSHYST